MTSIGTMLREARQAQGRSQAEVASELCITQRYLRAIEENDVETLPGLFFFQSFARQYGAIVGLDAGRVRQVLAAMEVPSDPTGANVDSRNAAVRPLDPIVEDTNRHYIVRNTVSWSVAGLAAAVLLGTGVFAWWSRPANAASGTAKAPARVVQSVQTQSVQSVPVVTTSTTASTAAQPMVQPTAQPPVEVTATAAGDHQVVLNLSATEKTWLSITSDGKEIFSGVLEPSQSKTLTGSEVATMKVGNAGGVDIQWNGKSIGPIGERGQVRTVRFTREHYHILSPSDEL